MAQDAPKKFDVVQLDGLVLMKIIKHCKESLPEHVSGQLLGLDIGNKLQVTNCFALPSRNVEEGSEESNEDEISQFTIKSLSNLREVNVDHNLVGWYLTSSFITSFINLQTIQTQFEFQKTLRAAVCIVYDPLRTTQGSLWLKAYRLSDTFMQLYATQQFSQEDLMRADFTDRDIFEEVKIHIHNSSLVSSLLAEWHAEEEPETACDFDRLDLSTNPFLEKNLESLIDCVDDLQQELNKYEWQKRKRTQNQQRRLYNKDKNEDDSAFPDKEPSRLESLLISNQVNNYCEQIHQFAGQSLSKLFTMGAMHKERA